MPFRVMISHRRAHAHSRLFARLVACLLLATSLACADDQPATLAAAPRIAANREDNTSNRNSARDNSGVKSRIENLIRQLGSPRFTERRIAASELRDIGPEAFDRLHAATDDSDPEVAASAHYLLQQINVRWVRNDDSPAVRTLLSEFGEQDEDARTDVIEKLARLPNGEGVAGICRIARYDRSPLVSRTAALAIIRPGQQSVPPTQVDSETVHRELGDSTREAVVWLRRYLDQLHDPGKSAEYWETLVDEESARLEQNADSTSPEIVQGLLWNLSEIYRQTNQQQALVGLLDRMLKLNPEAAQQIGIELIEWLVKHQNWQALDEILVKHELLFEQSKRLLYYAAMARAQQGNTEQAEQLAKQAAGMEPRNQLESFITAKDLEEHSQFDWAVREYRRGIDGEEVSSHESILSRIYLASLLYDYEQHEDAADALEPLVKAVQSEGRVGQLYTELSRYYRDRLALPTADSLAARYHFYRGLQYRDSGDRERERQELETAIKLDHTDADVLIAMYRLPVDDAEWSNAVKRRIEELCRQFQQEIDENPTDPTPYNQWAWLVSNTEGDYQKAIRYSHRSLELIPPNSSKSAGASFLDTLGRCYYAAGDIENAVKYQRQAIEKLDYMQVMHRQLALFEKTLAANVASDRAQESE